jgi:hypothetical protein
MQPRMAKATRWANPWAWKDEVVPPLDELVAIRDNPDIAFPHRYLANANILYFYGPDEPRP